MNQNNSTTLPVLWQPDLETQDRSHLYQFMRWLHTEKNLYFEDYHALWKWSCDFQADFWECIWFYFGITAHSPFKTVLENTRMPGARWFEGAVLNYAEHVFRGKNTEHPAIVFQSERHELQQISWDELEQQTAAFAAFLREIGIEKGDRVAAFLPNSPHAIAAALACMSIGAVWSSCSPDFGASSVADRFVQIQPRVLIAVDGYSYGGKSFDKTGEVGQLCQLLPSVEHIVLIPWLKQDTAPVIDHTQPQKPVLWDEIQSRFSASRLEFEPLPFSHPIWVLYSSGTTGNPKAITHSHGGNLLEHLKYLYFHNDVHPGERFFWYSTTGWMMWNFTLAALLARATIVLYDGSPGYPDLNVLWELAEKAGITHFGTSAPFLVSCMKAGLSPGSQYDLGSIRSIGSTGSPLPPEAFGYVYEKIKNDVWLSSMAGGTDVCTAWVGGNPLLPVYQGEIQCICLGCAMESWNDDGMPVPEGEVGEMVVTRPMPSMPVFFWNDEDGNKYEKSYFEQYPGVWRHGDWIQITKRGTVVILGRSDATLNRQGVRIGTAEIYRALDQIPEIRDSLIINLEKPDGTDWMPLFVLLNQGAEPDDVPEGKIKTVLRTTCSPRHVPDAIIVVPDIPYTISGKKMETPVKKIFQKRPLDKAYNPDSMRNPESMKFFIDMAEKL